MAARNPSSIGSWWDEEVLRKDRNIVETIPDTILTAQALIFDGPELIVSDFFKTIRTDEIHATNWTAAMEIARYYLECTDLCDEDGVSGVCRLSCSARVWCDAAAEAELRFQTLINGDSGTATFTNTTPAWVTVSSSVSAKGEGTQEDIQLDLKLTDGYTYAYCDAIAVWKVLA